MGSHDSPPPPWQKQWIHGETSPYPVLAASRWMLLAILAAAPWAYGCIRWWVIPWFTGALLVTSGLWLVGLVLRMRRTTAHWGFCCATFYLLAHGWLLVANAGYRYDRAQLQFVEVKPLLAAWLPGAIDTAMALPMMLRITGLLGVAWMAADAARHAQWRRNLFWTGVVGSTLLIVYGFCQRVSPVPLLFWEQKDLEHNLFATYYYHGNASAFMNLLLPFAFGAAVYGFHQKQRPILRAFGVAALFLNVAAAVAIASKAGQIVTALLLVALVLAYRRELLPSAENKRTARRPTFWLTTTLVVLLCVGGLAFTSDTAQRRWQEVPRLLEPDHNARLLAYRACLRMLPDAGLWGIGADNFRVAFPHYTYGLPEEIMGLWEYAHEDYLQTVIEWGWIGAAGWGFLFFGACWRGWRGLRARAATAPLSLEEVILPRSALLALGGVALHATVDYPLQIGSIELYIMVFAGLLWHQPDRARQRTDETASPSQRSVSNPILQKLR